MGAANNATIVIAQKARDSPGPLVTGNAVVILAHAIKYLQQITLGGILVDLQAYGLHCTMPPSKYSGGVGEFPNRHFP